MYVWQEEAVADHGEAVDLSAETVVAEAAAAAVAAVLLEADPSAAAKAVVAAVVKEIADLLGVDLIYRVLPVQVVRFSGVAPLSEAHLLAVPIILVVVPEVVRAAV